MNVIYKFHMFSKENLKLLCYQDYFSEPEFEPKAHFIPMVVGKKGGAGENGWDSGQGA